jgi:CheY-specific phosphatase CheX
MEMRIPQEQLIDVVSSVLSTALELAVEPVSSSGDGTPECSEPLTAQVSFHGAWEGRLKLVCPLAFARVIGSKMFAVAMADVSESDAMDALGEVANITVGNLLPVLPHPCSHSTPSVASNGGAARDPKGWSDIADVACMCEGYVLRVSLASPELDSDNGTHAKTGASAKV